MKPRPPGCLQKGLGLVPKLNDNVAFEKGVEWFTEVFCFYGVLAALAYYEMSKNEASRLKQVDTLNKLTQNGKAHTIEIAKLEDDFSNLEKEKLIIDQNFADLKLRFHDLQSTQK